MIRKKQTIDYLIYFSTLWVKSINNAVEEWQIAEKSVQADKAVFTIPGKWFILINEIYRFVLFKENKPDSKTAVARLLLVVQEAHNLMPLTTTRERHR